MINLQAKIHDRFSIEFKVGFNANREERENKFTMNTWIFIPYSLDINHSTYSKNLFYRDLRCNTRLITPVYQLSEIVGGRALPITLLENSFKRVADDSVKENIGDLEYNIKMFAAIFKSSVRDQVFYIINPHVLEGREELCKNFISDIDSILERYRMLYKIIGIHTIPRECFNYYLFGDEFMSNVVHKHVFRLMKFLKSNEPLIYKECKERFTNLIQKEVEHRAKRGFPVVEKNSPVKNRDLVYRTGALKKYIESELFLNTKTKKDGILIEQIYLSLAAGISMIFATAIAFSFQLKYGNFTMPLFVALVISYMLKDRIKELTRYYFAHKLKEKYFDHKTSISINEHNIGLAKEGFDFITEKMVPAEVLRIRARTPLLEADNRYSEEKIILYRKLVELDMNELDSSSEYFISGINEILRFNLTAYLQKMDDPAVPLYIISNHSDYEEIMGTKVYYLNFIIQLKSGEGEQFKRYRIVFNRCGIKEIENLSP